MQLGSIIKFWKELVNITVLNINKQIIFREAGEGVEHFGGCRSFHLKSTTFIQNAEIRCAYIICTLNTHLSRISFKKIKMNNIINRNVL